MTTEAKRKSELDRDEADRLWSRVTEIDDKLDVLDKSVGVMGNELMAVREGLRSGLMDINRTLREMNQESTRSKNINWQGIGVAVTVLISFLGMAYWIMHREVEHVKEIFQRDIVAVREYEDLREDRAYWKIKAELAK
jgi:hypothetical protein